MDEFVDRHPERAAAAEKPVPFRFPQPHHRNKYRWVLLAFVAAVLAGCIYVGWHIVVYWEDILDRYFS